MSKNTWGTHVYRIWNEEKLGAQEIEDSIFQYRKMSDVFACSNRLQKYRPCGVFDVLFIKHKREAEGE